MEAAEAVQAVAPLEPVEPVEPAVVAEVPMEPVVPRPRRVAPVGHLAPMVAEAAIEPLVPVQPEVPLAPAAMEPAVRIEPVDDSWMMDAEANNNATTKMVPIGSGKTMVPLRRYLRVKWDSYTVATRTLLRAVFPRSVLATHSLTGKRSPAFLDKPVKACLNEQKVEDIVIHVLFKFKVKKSLVRKVITTKCADECKMLRMKENRRPPGDGNASP
ncbi:protein insensitive isoform X2 [Spodoptera frugiperda]|nr:protein insensitive isoform X2 [Spodoptera frugiperda]